MLVLTNAIYFKARWEMPFDESSTRPADFHLLDGSTVSTAMMEFHENSMQFERCDGDGWTALSLPYDLDGRQGVPWYESELSMIVIVPDEGRFTEFEDSFNREKLEEIISSYNYGPVHFFMPKFTYRFHVQLRDALLKLGLDRVFSNADLSGMLDASDTYVRNVIHEAFIAVDEKGTEAAAATAIGVDLAGGELLELTIDRPFLYVIRDYPTGTILFIGRVLNPLE
jgi:serpin B